MTTLIPNHAVSRTLGPVHLSQCSVDRNGNVTLLSREYAREGDPWTLVEASHNGQPMLIWGGLHPEYIFATREAAQSAMTAAWVQLKGPAVPRRVTVPVFVLEEARATLAALDAMYCQHFNDEIRHRMDELYRHLSAEIGLANGEI